MIDFKNPELFEDHHPTYWNAPCDAPMPQYIFNKIKMKYHRAITIFARLFGR